MRASIGSQLYPEAVKPELQIGLLVTNKPDGIPVLASSHLNDPLPTVIGQTIPALCVQNE